MSLTPMEWDGSQAKCEKTLVDQASSRIASGSIIITGTWSGKVVRTDAEDFEDRSFKFDCVGGAIHVNNNTDIEAHGGYVGRATGANTAIIGISLEHIGLYVQAEDVHEWVQMLGWDDNGNDVATWGAKINATALTVKYNSIYLTDVTKIVNGGTPTISHDQAIRNGLSVNGSSSPISVELYPSFGQNRSDRADLTIDTDLPIFATDADLLEYCNSEGAVTNKILNVGETPEERFIKDQKYYKIKNLYARGSGSTWTPVKTINYRIKPVGGKICLYYHKPTANEPYEWVLYNYSGYDIYRSPSIVNDDDEDFTLTTNIERHYLEHSVKFGDASYRVNIFDSDVPKWQSKEDADDYIRGDKDITEALNYDYIARTNQEILGPEIGLADAGNDNGHNGMVYSYGARMYVMSSSHLAGFFADVFNTANIDDILDGTKLFGANQINAISGIMYFPCAISEFCDITSEGATPHVGTWVCPTATSNGYVVKNNKLIDCGGDFLKPIYGDFRDLEPYQQLWVTLPFCGTHQLQLTKYLNRYISFKYSIDAVTGACACHIYADGIEMDTFEGVCSSQRCISAIDQTTYLSNVIGSVNSALTSGVSGVSSGAQAIGGLMSGNVGSVVGGSAGMLGAGASGILGAYNVMQAVDNPPMTTRGGSSGCLGFFGCTQIHLHFYQKKTVKPVHALMLCGAPSNVSGTVSSFAGFLKCSTFKMSDGFTGTNDELNEIMQLMSNGIYV